MSFERMQKCYDMMFHYRSGIAKQNGKWKKMKQRLKLREEQIDHMRVQHKRKETLRDFIDKFEKRKRARLANVVTDFRKKQDERRRKKGVENENDCEGTGNDDEKDNAKSASLQIPTKQIPYLNTITGLTPNIGSGKFDAQSIKHLRARDMELDTDGNDILQERLRRHRLSSLDAYVKAKTFEDRKEKDLKYRKLGGRDTQTTSSLASSNSRSSVSRSQYQPPQAYLRHMKPSTMRMSRYKKNERDHGHKEEYLQEKEKEGARMKSRKDRRATSSSYFSDDTFSSEKGRPVERFRPGSKMTNQRRSLKLSESPESPPALTPASSSPTYKERSRSRRSRGGTRHGSLDGTPAVTTEEKHSVVQSLFRDSSTSRNKRRK